MDVNTKVILSLPVNRANKGCHFYKRFLTTSSVEQLPQKVCIHRDHYSPSLITYPVEQEFERRIPGSLELEEIHF